MTQEICSQAIKFSKQEHEIHPFHTRNLLQNWNVPTSSTSRSDLLLPANSLNGFINTSIKYVLSINLTEQPPTHLPFLVYGSKSETRKLSIYQSDYNQNEQLLLKYIAAEIIAQKYEDDQINTPK